MGVEVGPGADALAARLVSESTPTPPSPIKGEEWDSALAAFHAAEAEVAAIEAATAGRSAEEEEAWLPRHDAACEAMEEALEQLLTTPAPDRPALAAKLELFFTHALEPHAAEDEPASAILADAHRLLLPARIRVPVEGPR